MRGDKISIVAGIICVGFLTGAVINVIVPYQNNTVILEGAHFGILRDLNAPFHAYFPIRSFDQAIDISIACTNGSLDMVVIKSLEWNAWVNDENYTSYYEVTNVTTVMTTVEIDPSYVGSVDIIMQTNYGDVEMSVNIISHAMEYDYVTAFNSFLLAQPFGLFWIYYAVEKKQKTTEKDSKIDVY